MAHAYLSSFLTGRPVEEFLRDDDPPVDIPAEDIQLIKDMAQLVQDMAALDGCELLVERQIHGSFGGHEIRGTADIILKNDDRLMMFDYKHGAGRKVAVENNPQITLYLLMAIATITPGVPREVEMGIIQPRGRGEGLTTWIPSKEYLETFEKNVVAAIERAYVPDPAFNPGPWCWGCSGVELGVCPTKLMEALRFATGVADTESKAVTPAWWLLDYAKTAEKMAKKLSEEARERLKEGGEVPGWTLKDKLGNRRWREPREIPDVLARIAGGSREDFIKVPKEKTISITDAKHNPLLKGHDLEQYMDRPLNRVLVHSEEVPESYLDEVE